MTVFSCAKKLKRIAWTIISISVLLACFGIPLSVFLCNPYHESWNTFVDQRCHGSGRKGESAFGILNIVLDVVVLALPLLWIWPLKMHINKKIGLTIVFSCGIMYVWLWLLFNTIFVVLTTLVPALPLFSEYIFSIPIPISMSSSLGSSFSTSWSLR